MSESNGNIRIAVGEQMIDYQAVNLMKEAMTQINNAYTPYFGLLIENQHKYLLRTRLKNHGFIEEVVRIVAENSDFVSGYISEEKFMDDYTDYKNRRVLYDQSQQISRGMENGLMVASDTCLRDAYTIYTII